MSTGGIFQLITNDGKQDRMLMASDLLRNRLDTIKALRERDPTIKDPTPTLLDIEKTHVIFTNAHFKPFVAIGFEYNKTNASSGNATLGSDVTFSIPQFGDFFHDMVLYIKLKQPTLTLTASDVSDQPLMRWCPYPGERICKTVEFEVNGNPLDKYRSEDVNFHREFCVPPNKKLGWDRCVGQEEAEVGYVDQPNWADSGVAPSAIAHRVGMTAFSGDQTPSGQKDVAVYKELLVPLLFWCNRDVRLSVPSVAIPYGQRFIKVSLCQGEELVNLVPRGAGGWTDSTIGGSLNYDNMLRTIELYINNIFVNPEIHKIFIHRIGFTLIRVHRQQILAADKNTNEVLLNQLKWPIETMFVGMRMKDYNSTDTTLRRQHLDKWHTFCKVTDTARKVQGWRNGKLTLKNDAFALPQASLLNINSTATNNLRLTGVTGAAAGGVNLYEGINAGDILEITLTTANTTSTAVTSTVVLTLEVAQVVASSVNDPSGPTYHNAYILFKQLVQDVSGLTGMPTAANVTINNGTTIKVYRSDSAEMSGSVPVQSPTIDALTIKAHGIPIYNNFMSKFYNAYLSYQYGGPNLNAPKDLGALLIPFNLYPGSYQPSGHINVSRAREFYLSYDSSVIDTNNNGILIVSAMAINFLLISDGSAVLRYST